MPGPHLRLLDQPYNHFNMAPTKQVYLFGDQTANFSDGLGSLLRSQKGPLLSNFFDRASAHLRSAAFGLPERRRECFPRFFRLEELVEIQQEKALHPALQQAMTTIYHFASFIS